MALHLLKWQTALTTAAKAVDKGKKLQISYKTWLQWQHVKTQYVKHNREITRCFWGNCENFQEGSIKPAERLWRLTGASSQTWAAPPFSRWYWWACKGFPKNSCKCINSFGSCTRHTYSPKSLLQEYGRYKLSLKMYWASSFLGGQSNKGINTTEVIFKQSSLWCSNHETVKTNKILLQKVVKLDQTGTRMVPVSDWH